MHDHINNIVNARLFLSVETELSVVLARLIDAEKDKLNDLYGLGGKARDYLIALERYKKQIPQDLWLKRFEDPHLIGRCKNYIVHEEWYEENKDHIKQRRENEELSRLKKQLRH